MRLYELICEGKPGQPPEVIQKIKDLWDQDLTIKEIAARMNLSFWTIKGIIEDYKERQKRSEHYPDEVIQKIKDLFDQNVLVKDIASEVGLDIVTVNRLIHNHYGDRDKRSPPEYSSEDIELVKSLYDTGLTYAEVQKETGFTNSKVRHIIDKYHKNRKSRAITPATPEQIIEITKMFVDGTPNAAIGKLFGKNESSIRKITRLLPNYEELLQQRLVNIDLHKEAAKAAQVNKKIYRPGSIGNDRLQGPKGRSNRGTRNKDYF